MELSQHHYHTKKWPLKFQFCRQSIRKKRLFSTFSSRSNKNMRLQVNEQRKQQVDKEKEEQWEKHKSEIKIREEKSFFLQMQTFLHISFLSMMLLLETLRSFSEGNGWQEVGRRECPCVCVCVCARWVMMREGGVYFCKVTFSGRTRWFNRHNTHAETDDQSDN